MKTCSFGCRLPFGVLTISIAIRMIGTLLVFVGGASVIASNFSIGEQTASKFGVHEIVLHGDDRQGNPFDVEVKVTFKSVSESDPGRSVYAFYDGNGEWRARFYVDAVGRWTWSSECLSDPRMNQQSGAFQAIPSQLPGRLMAHPKNPRQWVTENGDWFLHLSDTAYFLLCERDGNGDRVSDRDALQYVREDVEHGITAIRCFLSCQDQGFSESTEQWESWFFHERNHDRLALEKLQHADRRLHMLFERFPSLFVQLILFPLEGYAKDGRFWQSMNAQQRNRLLRYLISRFAAYPQVFWLFLNDAHFSEKFPNNVAMGNEVGNFFQQHDLWQHPRSIGHARLLPFALGHENWCDYIHIEHAHDLGALQYAPYHALEKPVFLGEDRYEQDHGPSRDPFHMRYWQRRLFWTWLLSGGSANYGGRWFVVHPYRETGTRKGVYARRPQMTFTSALTGLDSVRWIRSYFQERSIDLGDYVPDHTLALDIRGLREADAPKLMRRGDESFLVYHPNAVWEGQKTMADVSHTVSLKIDLRSQVGSYQVEWYRTEDGTSAKGAKVEGGGWGEFTSPWKGADVVLRLYR